MPMATYHTSASVPRYDNQRGGFPNGNYQVPPNDLFGMGLEESFYPRVQAPISPCPPVAQQPTNNFSCFPPHQMGLAPTLPANLIAYYNALVGLQPTFQPLNGVPQSQAQPSASTSLASSAGPSTSLQGALPTTPSLISLPIAQKVSPKTKSKRKRAARIATQTAKGQLLIGKPRRKRGPNKRPAGTAFSNLLDCLPEEVKEALERDYNGCCETVNIKDASTKQKHMFSLRHCRNIPAAYQECIPNFVCPAFIALKTNCRSKASRYDSTDRHCRNCAGFLQMCGSHKEPFPVVITRSQYTAIHRYRTIRASREGKQASGDQPGEQQQQQQADDEFRLVLANMFKDGFPDWLPLNELRVGGESNDAGPSEVPVVSAQQPTEITTTMTTTTTTTATTPAAAPHTLTDDFDQILNDESLVFDPEFAAEGTEGWKDGFPPILDEAGFDISVAYANALSSSTTPESSPDPVGSSQELPPYQPSGLELVDKKGESTSASGPSTSPAPAPLARVEEQHSVDPPSHLNLNIDLDGFYDSDATHAFLAEFFPS